MGRVVALMDDLFFQMKLAETAKQLGVEVKVATNGDAFLGLIASEPKLVIVDLNARSQPLASGIGLGAGVHAWHARVLGTAHWVLRRRSTTASGMRRAWAWAGWRNGAAGHFRAYNTAVVNVNTDGRAQRLRQQDGNRE